MFDTAALEAVAASPDVEVTINISNVTLRSALELMLKEVEDLTYIVDNEVLLITTEEEADTRLQVKVYPVADLVLPIENLGIAAAWAAAAAAAAAAWAAAAWAAAAWAAAAAAVWRRRRRLGRRRRRPGRRRRRFLRRARPRRRRRRRARRPSSATAAPDGDARSRRPRQQRRRLAEALDPAAARRPACRGIEIDLVEDARRVLVAALRRASRRTRRWSAAR